VIEDAEVRALEHVGDRTWPTMERYWFDGWLLRASAGVTRRSNSVTPLEPSSIDLAEKIAFVERWFAQRSLPPIVRSLPIDEAGLPKLLVARGYRHDPGAYVMTRRIGELTGRPRATVVAVPDEAWMAALSDFGDDRGNPVVMRRMLSRLGTAAYASILEDGDPVAIGMAAVDGNTVALYNMNVAPTRRRLGLGAALLDSLLGWGVSQGAVQAMLQVQPANTGGIAFYQSADFEHRYTYSYWQAPD
jgi:N-acetylglutamate synthase